MKNFEDHFWNIFWKMFWIIIILAVIALIAVIKIDQHKLNDAKENGTLEITDFEVTNSAQIFNKEGAKYEYTLGVYHPKHGAHVLQRVPENLWAQYSEGTSIKLLVNTYEYGGKKYVEVSIWKNIDPIEPADINNVAMHSLAKLVSNQDYSVERIDEIAKENGFASYDAMVEHLVDIGELVYIPKFEYTNEFEETISMGGFYSIKGTTVYNIALEMGIIE